MQYLSYEEYVARGGQRKDETGVSFARWETDARAEINLHTYNRLVNEDPIREAVKLCMVRLIDIIGASSTVAYFSAGQVVSESNDGVSRTIKHADANERSAELLRIIRRYLAYEIDSHGTPLLYRGVRS